MGGRATRTPSPPGVLAALRTFLFGMVLCISAAFAVANDLPAPVPTLPVPQQTAVAEPQPWTLDEFTVMPLATYRVTARVLSSRRYDGDRESRTSPIDLALGWGAMADPDVLASYEVRQRDRWFFVRWDTSPLARDEIVRSSANTHVIPATSELARQLEGVRPGQVVQLEGYLVEVSAADGWRWRSSLSRDDTGQGACEVFWVESLSVHDPG